MVVLKKVVYVKENVWSLGNWGEKIVVSLQQSCNTDEPKNTPMMNLPWCKVFLEVIDSRTRVFG